MFFLVGAGGTAISTQVSRTAPKLQIIEVRPHNVHLRYHPHKQLHRLAEGAS